MKPALLHPDWEDPEYKYFGEGLDKGQCGIQVNRVRSNNHGKARCFLGVERQELSGEIDLVVACKL